jgi:6-phosphogluconolactonase
LAQTPDILVLASPAELFRAAAEQFRDCAAQAVAERGRFSVALSGGSTPKGLYSLLASGSIANIPWDKICFFWGDERHVPPDHPESNFRMAQESLLSKVPVPADHVFRIRGEEQDADVAARQYERALATFFALQPGQFPRFDLILLGIGPDGHTASLFPGSTAVQEDRRLVVATWVEKFKTYRITFTYPVINRAACVMFLVDGADKAAVVQKVFQDTSANLPAQKIQPSPGKLLWLLDSAAASGLKKKSA